MRKEGHLGVSLLLTVPISLAIFLYGFPELAILFGATAIPLFSFPDIDITLQKLTGKNGIPVLRNLITISHRGITHTVWFSIFVGSLLGGVGYYVADVQTAVVLFAGGFLGITFHVIGDMFTPHGIKYFYTRTTFNMFNYNNLIANIGILLCGILSVGTLSFYGEPWFWLAITSIYTGLLPIVLVLSKYVGISLDGSTIPFISYLDLRSWLK